MIQTIKKAWAIPELRKKIVFTALILLIFRIGNAIPVPYVDTKLLGDYLSQMSTTVLGLYDVMSGGAFASATVFALGVQPYINSSIIIQLLTVAIPALERLAKVRKITFDKTGTLTRGVPEVVEVVSISRCSESELLSLAAAAEQFSEHPLGRAIVRCRQRQAPGKPLTASDFRMVPGQGVAATADGKRVRAGNLKFIGGTPPDGIESRLARGCTIIFVELDGDLSGYIVLSDTVRDDSAQMLGQLARLGVQPVLLTGDNEGAANAIAAQLKIREVYAGCLPEDKLNRLDDIRRSGKAVCMIGDGVNDAPALRKADVGIAMGGVGSDIAIDASDIALVKDDLAALPHLLALSRRMMTAIRCNLAFSMGLNFLAIALAITGLLNPVAGALVHNAGSVLVILNAAWLLKWKSSI